MSPIGGEKDTDNVELFKRFDLTKLCADTVGIWLKKLVFCTTLFQITIMLTGMRRSMLFGTYISL